MRLWPDSFDDSLVRLIILAAVLYVGYAIITWVMRTVRQPSQYGDEVVIDPRPKALPGGPAVIVPGLQPLPDGVEPDLGHAQIAGVAGVPAAVE